MNHEQTEVVKRVVKYLDDMEHRGDYDAKNLKYQLKAAFKYDLPDGLSHEAKMLLKEMNENYGLGIG
jgi:glutamate synthase domain-containing protein 1